MRERDRDTEGGWGGGGSGRVSVQCICEFLNHNHQSSDADALYLHLCSFSEREKERERDRGGGDGAHWLVSVTDSHDLSNQSHDSAVADTGWRRLIGCLKLQVIFHKATNYRALLQKMTYKDKASNGSSPPCTLHLQLRNHSLGQESQVA